MSLLSHASAERVELRITQTTTFGNSVFVTAPELSQLGAGAMDRAAKMHPTSYPVWSLDVEVPAGVTITPHYYMRNDSPGQLASTSNGTLITVGQPITVPAPEPIPPHVVHLFTTATEAQVQVSDYGPLHQKDAAKSGEGWLTLEIPGIDQSHDRTVSITAGGVDYPPTGAPVRMTGRATWWRHGQAFHYLPPVTAPAAPRIETFQFTPAGFGARTIRVVLPRGYDTNTSKRYPVIYALDGQNLLSVSPGPFGSWDLDLTMRSLIARGEIPEAVLVGIDNTNIRHVEYNPEWGGVVLGGSGRGGEFIRALRDGLLPEIATRYRVHAGAAHRLYMGSSLGGLSGYEVAHEYRDVWGTVIAMSPSTQVNTNQWLALAERGSATRSRMWIDSGTAGGSSDGYANTIRVRDALLSTGGEALGTKFYHFVGLGQQHNEAAWRGRSPEALRWALKDWSEPAVDMWMLR